MRFERFERAYSNPTIGAPAAGGPRLDVRAISKKAGMFILKKIVKGVLAFAFLYIVVYVFHEMQAQGFLG